MQVRCQVSSLGALAAFVSGSILTQGEVESRSGRPCLIECVSPARLTQRKSQIDTPYGNRYWVNSQTVVRTSLNRVIDQGTEPDQAEVSADSKLVGEVTNLLDRSNVCCVEEFRLVPRADGGAEILAERRFWLRMMSFLGLSWSK